MRMGMETGTGNDGEEWRMANEEWVLDIIWYYDCTVSQYPLYCFLSCPMSLSLVPCPCPVMCCSILSCSVLSSSVLAYPALSCPGLSFPVSCHVSCPSCLPLSQVQCPVPFPTLSCPALWCFVLSCPVLPVSYIGAQQIFILHHIFEDHSK